MKGYSTGSNLLPAGLTGVKLNVAVSGQESNHIPNQARLLIDRLKESKDIDFENDWKLVTLFIGGNDLNRFCDGNQKHKPASYINYLRESLDILQQQLPKAIINLVSILNMKDLKDMNDGLVCTGLHTGSCAAYPKSDEVEEQLEQFFREYTALTQELVASGRYDTGDQFTVVVQPFYRDFPAPRLPNGKVDLSFFAPDCFHFSAKSHGKYSKNFLILILIFL